ncbi:MAG: nucleotidyltransferase domain-containing protein [Campylobacterales bacterium]|nr:nucleotidyltransferase domain-containing protein [Campylobacterales bacterium]
MQQEMLDKIKILKESLRVDGFIIDGIFGSYARDDQKESSDVDILYHLDDIFYTKYCGFAGFQKLEEIKRKVSDFIEKKVDFAPKNNLSKTAQKHILKDVIYV